MGCSTPPTDSPASNTLRARKIASFLHSERLINLHTVVFKGIKVKWEDTLLAYEEDIKSRSVLDWLKAHTSGFKPLHRYRGTLELDGGKIVFNGKDLKEGADFHLEIAPKDITDVYLGWDSVYTGFPGSKAGDRAYPWNKPLRIRYRSEEGEKTIYIFANFHHRHGIRASDNRQVLERLKPILEVK
jgi:hypothetical protein